MSRRPSLLASAIKPVEKPAFEPTPPAVASDKSDPRSTQSTGSYVAPSRANKMAKTHYLPPAYWKTLEEISFRTRDSRGKRIPQERLVAEALNLLFARYNYPQVSKSED